VLGTEAYDTEESGGRMDHLVTAMRAAGVEGAPQTAVFSVPAMYAAAYPRPARAAGTGAPAAIPAQRGAPEPETLQEVAAASEAGAGG
jgi:hypothetical protein